MAERVTWRSAQSTVPSETATPSSRARQSRNASEELPSVKTTAARRNRRKPRVGANPTWTGAEGGFTRGLSFTATTTKTIVSTPGNADQAMTCRTDSPPASRRYPTSVPITAPEALERMVESRTPVLAFSDVVTAAVGASRGLPRTPLPTRSPNRSSSTCHHEPASASSGQSTFAIA